MTTPSRPLTRETFLRSLSAKTGTTALQHLSAGYVADLIRLNQLERVIAGRHDNRPVTHAQAFELVYGERLTLTKT